MRILLILFIAILSSNLMAQTTWVADNNFNAPTGPNVFPTIQQCIDAASDGDIIQVQPSPNTYGNASINKPNITLMGIGFNVDKDIPLISSMGTITLTNNLDNTSDADGTIIKGLNFTILYPGYNTGPSYSLLNILVQNCQIQYVYTSSLSTYSPITNMEIRDCYIHSNVSGYSIYLSDKLSNGIIRNNLLSNGIALTYAPSPGSNIISNNIMYGPIYVNVAGSNTTITNNNFMASSGGDNAFDTQFQDCIVANNIFFGMTPSMATGGSTSTNFQRNVFTNNLVFSTGDDTMPPTGGGTGNSGSGNITGTSPLFTNVQLLNTWSSAYDFTLQVGSPALLAGSDGTDIGISGGAYPLTEANFILKTSPVPVIQILNTSTIINPGDDLPVRIKAKSN